MIGEVLQSHEDAAGSSIANWFRGAEQVNAGKGAFSVFIRSYTQHQMTLRGIGSQYSESAMQNASNEIARRAIDDMFKSERLQSDGTWRFPSIAELARFDATAVGAVLFNSLDSSDAARELQQNAAWAGAILFASLGVNQSERLTANSGDAGLDRLEDLKNVLFAYDSIRQAAVAVAVEGSGQIGTDFLIGFWTGWNEPGELIALIMQDLSGQLSESARPFGDMIQRFGVSTVLNWIESSIEGKPVSGSNGNISGRVDQVFGGIGIGDQREWAVQLLPQDSAKIAELAKADAAVRNALLALSPIIISLPSYSGDTSLYDPETGTGALSEDWIGDRAQFMHWDRWYRQSGQTDGVLDEIGGLPFKDGSDIWFLDSSSDYSLKVKGFDIGAPQQRVWFGGDFSDRFAGADGNDRFYGGNGSDQIQGGAGDDYIEGDADNDNLDGGQGQDKLVGGEGNDTLTGGAGSDVLEGGRGSDTYMYASGDGNDTIIDTDGRILFDGSALTGGLSKKGESVYRSRDGKHEYTWWGDDLLIDGKIVVRDFKNGNLGIYIDEESDDPEDGPPPPPPYDPNSSRRAIDPLAFDLNDNGIIDTVSSGASSAYFDFNGDSVAERTGWISGGDGLLAFDANGNGAIDNLSELFGTADVDGFTDLKRRVDSNHDNIVDARDAQFSSLLMWRDLNSDGIAQAHELSTLTQLGIESINLAATPVNMSSGDNRISATSQFRRNGKLGVVGDVEFAVDFAATDSNPTRPLDEDIAFDDEVYTLPWLRGFGLVKNLNYAYQDDLVLRQAAIALAAKDSRTIVSQFEALLARWTGLDAAHAKAGVTRGGVTIDDKVWMMETLTGQNIGKKVIEGSAFDTAGSVPWDIAYVEGHYRDFMLRSATAFAMQAASDDWLQGAFYSLTQDRFVIVNPERVQAGLRSAVLSLASQDEADFAAIALLRLKSDGIDLGETGLREVLARSPYALTLLAALDANLEDFADVDWAIQSGYADAATDSASSLLIGSSGADRLVGSSGNDTMLGHAGADVLEGGAGDDLYLFERGDGRDTIVETATTWGPPGTDVIRLGAGIGPADVSFERSGTDLVMRFAGSDDRLTIAAWGGSALTHIERVEFADGTVWDSEALNELVRATAASGSSGDDYLQAWTGADDLLRGLAGDDILYGGNGNDVLDGGTGNDYMYGGSGDDTYLFRRGDGADKISESGTWDDVQDTIRFGPGITAADVVLRREGGDLVFELARTDDRITVVGWVNAWFRIERVVFDDGSEWSAQHLDGLVTALALTGTAGADSLIGWSGLDDTLLGLDGDDYLRGASGNDLFEGGAGNDVMEDWYGGADTYVFRRGDGQDVIEDGGDNDTAQVVDVIRFGEDIVASDIVLSREDRGLVFAVAGTGDRVLVRRWGEGARDRIERVEFADGTAWDVAELESRVVALTLSGRIGTDGSDTIYGWIGINETLQGGGGNDTLVGDSGNDMLEGGTGDDLLYGGTGADTYLFSRGDGQDTISEKIPYQDGPSSTVVFGPGIAQSDIVMVLDDQDILIRIKGGDDQIRIKGWALEASYGLERAVFADGTVWDEARLRAEIATLVLVGTDGYDSLFGGDGNNTLIGAGGDDYLAGGAGNDVYVFNRGDGQDTIYDVDYTPNQDTIRFGAGITAADIEMTRQGMSLVIGLAGSADRITIASGFWHGHGVERIEFADGTAWEPDELRARIAAVPYIGTDNDDDIQGDSGDNVLVGGGGNDQLQGGAGSDIYLFERGSGHDTITETQGDPNSQDVVRFGAGFSPLDAVFRRDGQGTVLEFIGSGDSVTFYAGYEEPELIERVEFADGTVWDKAYLNERIRVLPIVGTDGNDDINGDSADNVIVGGDGNDVLSGGAGNDVYLFDRGDGQDTIYDADGVEGNVDTIRFGASIASGDVSFYRDRYGYIVLAIAGGYDQIMLGSWHSGRQGKLARIEFADGDAWDLETIMRRIDAAPFTGTSGPDSLYGTDGDNIFAGGAGDDYLSGGGGSDVYLFERSDGQDVISEAGDADVDVIRFGTGIVAGDIIVSRDGNDMVFALAQTDDSITVRYWRQSDYYRIERVEFADGTVWDRGMLAAMDAALPLTGTDGNDSISGDDRANTLAGGKGDDYLSGGRGADTYLFNLGDGRDTISETGDGDVDTIRFGAGIAAADIEMTRENGALILAVAGTEDRVVISGWSSGAQYQIERVEFADGAVWDGAALAAKASAAPIMGTDRSDTLSGDQRDDVFNGRAGNDHLSGGGGSDTYLFGLGDGQDYISESGYDDLDTIRFGAGISAADIVMSFEGSSLILAIAGTTDRITIGNWRASDYYRVERVEFADGTAWDSATLLTMIDALPVLGTDGDDYLDGDDGDDVFDGGAGNDILSAGAGSDTYVFELGDGQDRIDERSGERDTIRFGAGIGPDNIILSRHGKSLVFAIAGSDDRISVENWGVGDSYRIEQVAFDDGTLWDAAHLAQLVAGLPVLGTTGDDALHGWDGDDTLNGGSGNDSLSGAGGSDTYRFALGGGQDRILEAGYGGVDTISFGAGIAASDIVLSLEGDALVLGIRGTDDRISVVNWGSSEYYRVERVVFADGTSWNQDDLAAMVAVLPVLGTDGDDYLNGGEGDNLLIGGAGNDVLNGGAGYDTYVFELGDGQDRITESGSGDIDTIRFGAGVAASDIVMTIDGLALVLSIAGTEDRITVTNWDYADDYRVERVEFADGTVWDVAAMVADLPMPPIYGTNDDDYLAGGPRADFLDGGVGNDTLVGGWGDDTYLFERGDGQDSIAESGYDTADTIVFGAGIVESDIVLSFDEEALVFTIAGTNDRITVRDWKYGEYYRIERVVFADGVVWDAHAITQRVAAMPLVGTRDNDTLDGDSQDNTLIGGAGDDVLKGGQGNDTYLFELGDGHDTIYDFDYSQGNLDTIRFGAGIAADDIAISRTRYDLVLTVGATGDTLTIQNASSGSSFAIEHVEFADGTLWSWNWMLKQAARNPVLGTDQTDWLQGWSGVGETLIALGGDDSLSGGSGDDTFDGGTGDDRSIGYGGSDTYIFRRGDGRDTITDFSWETGSTDTIRFGEGIAASDIHLSRSGNDLLLSIDGSNDQLRVESWGMLEDWQIERIEFVDGTVWDIEAINKRIGELAGTEGADQLLGWANKDEILYGMGGDDSLTTQNGNDVLDGGTGNDYLSGGRGSDVYIFNAGDGQDEINESGAGDGAIDTLRFGDGIDASTLIFERSGDDLHINIGIDGDRVSVYAWAEDEANQIERIEFADGTVWDAAAIRARIPPLVSIGTEYNGSLEGWAGLDDTIVVGDGVDLAPNYLGGGTLRVAGSNDFLPLVTNESYHAPVVSQIHFLKVDQSDSADLVAHVDEARLAEPGSGAWAFTSAMLEFHLYSGTDTALGGGISYLYGTNSSQNAFGTDAASGLLSSPDFDVRRQSVLRTEIV